MKPTNRLNKLTDPITSLFRLARHRVFFLLLAAFALPGSIRMANAQTYSLSNAWNVAAGTGNITTDGGNRGIAYSVPSNQVFVAYRAGASTGSIAVYDGTAGTLLSGSTNVNGSNLGIDQIGVGDDGILYGAPLNTAISGSSAYKIYSWTNWGAAPYVCYASTNAGEPVTTYLNGKRLGDTMAVTGSGTNTLILVAANGLNSWVLLHTVDGTNFQGTVLTNSALPTPGGGVQVGLAFYTNNTFLLKPENSGTPNLYLVQFPANFASLSSPVACTILATNTVAVSSGSGYPAISYSPAGGLMALETNFATTASPVGLFLYSVTNFTTGANQLIQTTYATTVANGNLTESVALGGIGKTNWLYALDSNNGLHAYQITFTIGAVGPTIITQPVSAIGAYPPQTLTVAATGTAPITNIWYSNTASNTTGGTLLQSSTNTSFTVNTAVTNFYYVIVTNSAGSQTSSIVQLSLIPATTNAVVTSLFSIPPGTATYPFEANDDNTRGIAYDTNTGRLLVANKNGGPNIYLLDGTTGTNIGSMKTGTMLTGGAFTIDQVGVGDDGVVYAGNLATSPPFNLSAWAGANTNATAMSAFSADPGSGSGDRWGDNMAVRGAGLNTQILLSSRGTNVALLTTIGGTNFTSLLIPVLGVPMSFAGYGIAFGAGNTFWGKNYMGDLYEVSFDPTGATPAAVLRDYVAAGNAQIPSKMVGVGVDPVNNILGGVVLSDQNPDLQLFQLTGNANPPALFDQAFFPAYNPSANGNDLGVVVMKYPRAYALDVDLGIIGVTYGVPASTPPAVTTPPAGGTIYAANVPFSFSVGVSGTLPLYYQWQVNSVSNAATAQNISGATAATYTLSTPAVTNTGWYDVVITNFGGGITSTPVQLTVVQPVTSAYVTNIWRNAPGGTNSYLDSGSYNVRGLAYDTNTATVLVADRGSTTITTLNAANGSINSGITINTAGLPTGTFVLDQIGVADDGALYGGNLAITSLGDMFNITRWAAVSSTANENAAYGPADPGNGSGDRWGDTMAIRGSGTSTQILLGSYGQGDGPGTNVVLMQTADGSTFTSLLIGVSNVPSGFSSLGIAFGAGNTFWAKGGHDYDLRQVSFDPTGANPAVVLQDYSAPTQTPNDLTGLGVDANNNILIGTCFNDVPNDLQFYQLTGNTNSPVLFDQAFYGSENPNSQENAASVIKFPWAFGLDVNNGLVAVKYGVPPAPLVPFSVTVSNVPGTGIVLSWPSVPGHTYHVLGSGTVTTARSTWTTNATYAGSGGPLTYTNSVPSGTRFYAIQGQ